MDEALRNAADGVWLTDAGGGSEKGSSKCSATGPTLRGDDALQGGPGRPSRGSVFRPRTASAASMAARRIHSAFPGCGRKATFSLRWLARVATRSLVCVWGPLSFGGRRRILMPARRVLALCVRNEPALHGCVGWKSLVDLHSHFSAPSPGAPSALRALARLRLASPHTSNRRTPRHPSELRQQHFRGTTDSSRSGSKIE